MVKKQRQIPQLLIIKRLDEVIELLQHSLAVQLYLSGVPQTGIGKRIGIRAERVNCLLKGIKKRTSK